MQSCGSCSQLPVELSLWLLWERQIAYLYGLTLRKRTGILMRSILSIAALLVAFGVQSARGGLLTFTPIVFFGRVVDEHGVGVPKATVKMEYANTIFGKVTEPSDISYSDADGCFFGVGHGLGVVVAVSKDGYYETSDDHRSFCYDGVAGNVERHLTPGNRAVFVLHKMWGTSNMVSFTAYFRVPKDGTPVEIDLSKGYRVAHGLGDIKVEVWTHDEGQPVNSNEPYNWLCRITAPFGGLTARKGAFVFEAPETGFVPFDEINMPTSLGSEWRSRAIRQYFVKASGGRYARVEIEMVAQGDHFFRITYSLNTKPGARTLEGSTPRVVPSTIRILSESQGPAPASATTPAVQESRPR